jgi:hypothetical protein
MYECCICKNIVSGEHRLNNLDPCALILVTNMGLPDEHQKEQQFFCHFECFRKIVNNDGIMYIKEDDFPSIGEIKRDSEIG